jgi:hypothetical protein
MLFDLRGRGRRRTVQAIYLTLAILMGGGLVLFGIGGETAGGLLDGLGLTQGGSGNTGDDAFQKRIERAQKQTRQSPRNPAAWAALARAHYQLAGLGDNFNSETQQFTSEGKKQLQKAAAAWERYLALKPARPDDGLASFMVQAYDTTGLNQAAKGVQAAEIVATARPSPASYCFYAAFAYAAEQARIGDLATAEAIKRSPPAIRRQVKTTLAQAKQQGKQAVPSLICGAGGGSQTG